ncbi:LysR family transcriptional regulator [Musicola paradisiaca]|uniref:Transcriptional regulator, LysR family n=1 Tax=Musicola paradisiaca (strain Ech703) TaxID=579405 RepID=C6CD68_MUSP7|nr:LysR family transcriptional regulator [Musicola paradisiaca]ACS86939.1 transcriptional regulator, LysR family [Musicola paradisiaca Ech703]
MISIKRILYYHELVRHGSFTRAAQSLNISQAFLSQEISRLEQELNNKLINRTTRQFSLTAFGEAFDEKINPLIREYYEVEQFAQSYEESSDGTLLVGVIPVFNRLKYYDLLTQFQRHYPNIELAFIDGVSSDLLEKVRTSEIHVSLSTPFEEYLQDPLFNHSVFLEDDLVVVMASGHPLAANPVLSLSQLAAERPMVPQKGTGEYAVVSSVFAREGFGNTCYRECSNLDIIMDQVMHHACVVFLCASVASSLKGHDIEIRPVSVPIKRTFAVSYLKRSAGIPMVRRFLEFMEQHSPTK